MYGRVGSISFVHYLLHKSPAIVIDDLLGIYFYIKVNTAVCFLSILCPRTGHDPIRLRGSYQLDGKNKRKTKSGFRTKTEASAWENDMKIRLNNGYQIDKATTMFVDFYDDRLKRHFYARLASHSFQSINQ
ncbi:Arm DNA-binding domain-containing protein [Weissella confusa]|uniref:Arm DNA-binding domain-containing protein n=1 Tax=Weissella confusa TaxID=1583 RepID=UPI0035A2E209